MLKKQSMDIFDEHISNLVCAYAKMWTAGGYPELFPDHFRNYLYDRFDRETLKSLGAFFTSEELAQSLAKLLQAKDTSVKIVDPACGCGDLLLALLPRINVQTSLRNTLTMYSQQFFGFDLQPSFIMCTKLRIIAYAMKSGCEWDVASIDEAFGLLSSIRCADGLSDDVWSHNYDVIIMNPPFFRMIPDTCIAWSSGKVTAASLFLDKAVQTLSDGGQLLAILPDVIRGGSRYARLRKIISSTATTLTTDVIGRFDQTADVDVFLLNFIKGKTKEKECASWCKPDEAITVVGDYFDVRIGPVVPHRDPEEGPNLPFLTARSCPPWGVVGADVEKKQYAGTHYCGPFVVVRRTSSPRDKYRCVATLVEDCVEYAVENHLIILKPKDGSILTCRSLIACLKNKEINSWVNERIRCRHLTVSTLKKLPFPEWRK